VVTTGSISLSGTPEGAKVYLDGYYSGRVPCTIEQVEPGRHTLTVRKPGYREWEEMVRLVAGGIVKLEANLDKEAMRVVEAGPSVEGFTNTIGMEFVLIPPGKFKMGSPKSGKGRDKDERQHKVTISKPFYLQATEVTQRQWKAVMGSNPSLWKGDDLPVQNVSWDACREFIRGLNQNEEINKYRLPTEAEWEYACRAESTALFSFGDSGSQLGEYAWYVDNSGEQPHPVSQKKPNAWGLYDMHGNVWEWCEDRYGRYPVLSVSDPKGASRGRFRVNRGGSWNSDASHCRSANRDYDSPNRNYDSPNRNLYLGFRLAMTP